jgi:cell division protein FtsL
MENRNYYINGNAVRELEAAPARKPQQNPKETEEQKRRVRRQHAARRNRERALYMSKGYVTFLTLCVAVSAVFAVTYVKLQSDVSNRMKTIAALESQITDLKADNDANYKRITTSVDLNEVKDIAMNQLGMTYATEEQIIYYSVENSNYMDQYSDIPQK